MCSVTSNVTAEESVSEWKYENIDGEVEAGKVEAL